MRIQARAKINWTLDITGQREDGYHLMDMLMQPVTLHDIVTIEPAQAVTLTPSGTPLLPPDESHLALRAARALQRHTGCTQGAAIHVEKHIPVGAGMGGGSADAAAVLAGLNLLWHLGLTQAERPGQPAYLRMLGFNTRGQEVLRQMKERSGLPILTKPAHARRQLEGDLRLFELEARCTDLYDLCLETVPGPGREWTTGPVRM